MLPHDELNRALGRIEGQIGGIEARLTRMERKLGNGHGSMRDRVYLVGGGGTVSGLIIGVILAALKLLGA